MADNNLILDDFIPFRLSFTSNLVSSSIARIYQSLFDLSIPEWRVLAWVAQSDGISQRDICGRTGMDKLTVSRASVALTDRGLFERLPNHHDRRSHLLVLSEQGRSLYAVVAPKALELERTIFAGFEPDELAQFVAMLRRIDAIALGLGSDVADADADAAPRGERS